MSPAGVVVRRLFPGWRYVVIDYDLLAHPGVGVYCTNGRIIWGRREAEEFADRYCARSGRTWNRETFDAAAGRYVTAPQEAGTGR